MTGGTRCAAASRSPNLPVVPPQICRRPRHRRSHRYPALVRPSYVLGGRGMEIVYDDEGLAATMETLSGLAGLGREGGLSASRPVLIDRFLEDATEVDVDAIRDRSGEVLIGGIMEHVEEAGVHSGRLGVRHPPGDPRCGDHCGDRGVHPPSGRVPRGGRA